MNKIAQSLVAATAAIFLLAGCSAVSAEAQDVPEVSVTPSASVEPSESAGPVTVAPGEPSASPKSAADADAEAQFSKYIRSDGVLIGVESVPDADLLAAGHYACELFAQGQTFDKMDVIHGDEAALKAAGQAENRNDRGIADIASQTLCTEFDISK